MKASEQMQTVNSQPGFIAARDPSGRWIWLLALGAALLVLGLASAGATTLLGLTSTLVVGPLLLASSVMQCVAGFIGPGPGRFLKYAAAGLEAILGFLVMAHPVVLLTDLMVVSAAFLLAIGFVRMVGSLVTHSPGRVWALVAAGGALILGICGWLQMPVTGLWFVGLCVALDFICHGVSWSAVAPAEGKPLPVP
jgi:uncharacterized membrane protein HdeD (DUF308 family)